VTVNPGSASFTALGETARFTAEVRDQNGQVMAGAAVAWASSDASVATADASGLVTAAGNGAATITATAGSASGQAAVTVMQSAGSVAVTPSEATIGPGDTLRLVAEASDANGHPVTEFSWSSSDASVATVDGSGLVRGAADGTATVTAAAGGAEGTAEITVANPDRAALVALYEATDGPNWVNSENWLTDAPLTEWYGVETVEQGRVTGLILSNNNLSGVIPAELSKLARLSRLFFSGNELRGRIPPELGNLSNLTYLVLAGNKLSGTIPPEVGQLTRLSNLNVGVNQLTDPIPPELGKLSDLTSLGLQVNKFEGPLPPELGQLSKLNVLYLFRNNLTGPLPAWFLELDLLRFFNYQENDGFCTPGTTPFVAWRQRILDREGFHGPLCHEDDIAGLEALYEAAAGAGWSDADGWLDGLVLDDWYGIRTDSLGRVTGVDLSHNSLAGRLPSHLGQLAAMTELRIGGNALSGRLPQSLTALALRELSYGDTGLCTPADARFREWLSTISSHDGTGVECAPLSDRDILRAFYDATGGPGWTNDDNWLTDVPLREWHGVDTNSEGRVVSLRLNGNRLTGPIPPEFGNLASLTSLVLSSNSLSGSIPSEIGNLSSLGVLRLGGNELTGAIPAELGSLSRLTFLGLGANELAGSIPRELGNLDNLRTLRLHGNDLSGSIPSELGDLASLNQLWLYDNGLRGPIPAELGSLVNLIGLFLDENELAGPIPRELGNLTDLAYLWLDENGLNGPMPAELGNLVNLRQLSLDQNELSGRIPAELGNLAKLSRLNLGANELTGPIPPELGGLSELESLRLPINDLEGPVPPELGALTRLRELALSRNRRMSGRLPQSLTALRQLETFVADDTDLCAPLDLDFLNWLDGVPVQRIARCGGSRTMTYLTQAVQSPEFPVALVANEEALLRVFVTAARSNNQEIPPVRATLYANGAQAHVVDIPGKPGPIPTEVHEGRLASSANAGIPGHLVRPGLEMVIEVDPDGTLDPALGVTKRIPDTGRLAVDVRPIPLFDLTVIPFLWTESSDSSIVDITDDLTAESELLFETRTLLPVDSFNVSVHATVLSSSNDAYDLLAETRAIRVLEGASGHYMGTMAQPVTGARGVADRPGRTSFSIPAGWIMAHELGHNMSLEHPWTNPLFPSYPGGRIGAWGYDFRDGGRLISPNRLDIMMGCCWISDFHFTQALRFRHSEAAGVGNDRGADRAPVKSLLLWGGADADGVPYLEPAFVVDAPPAVPHSAGEYRITGQSADGAELFTFSFDMIDVADGDGTSSFAFALPARPQWEGRLASIALSGPAGSTMLDAHSDVPMAIVRDPRTGQVRALLRDGRVAAQAVADAVEQTAGQGLEVLFSRGIPDGEAWRR